MTYFVYILQCADGTYYTGSTNDIEKRLYAHNHLKRGARYTRSRRPVVLKYIEIFSTISDALKREISLKKLNKFQKEKLVKSADSLHNK